MLAAAHEQQQHTYRGSRRTPLMTCRKVPDGRSSMSAWIMLAGLTPEDGMKVIEPSKFSNCEAPAVACVGVHSKGLGGAGSAMGLANAEQGTCRRLPGQGPTTSSPPAAPPPCFSTALCARLACSGAASSPRNVVTLPLVGRSDAMSGSVSRWYRRTRESMILGNSWSVAPQVMRRLSNASLVGARIVASVRPSTVSVSWANCRVGWAGGGQVSAR